VLRLWCERLCGRRRKVEEIDFFFYHVADYVCVSVDLRYSFHHHHAMDAVEAVWTSSYDCSGDINAQHGGCG